MASRAARTRTKTSGTTRSPLPRKRSPRRTSLKRASRKRMKRNRPIPALISERRLRARVRAIGREIRRDYRGRTLVLVGVLRGSFIFMADLAREIGLPVLCDFMKISSYGSGAVSNGRVRFDFDISCPVRGKHLLFLEDIL